MTLMFQKEVAERICAKPRTKSYGRVSIISQWLCDCEIKFDLPPEAFTPAPKVISSIVYFIPRKRVDNISFHTMEKITAAAFGQRRKTIRKSLSSLTKERTDKLSEIAKIDPRARAEELTIDKFVDLAKNYEDMFSK